MPATRVRRILSEMICERIILGVAPMARRMPISVVRSFTVVSYTHLLQSADGPSLGNRTFDGSLQGARLVMTVAENHYLSGSHHEMCIRDSGKGANHRDRHPPSHRSHS